MEFDLYSACILQLRLLQMQLKMILQELVFNFEKLELVKWINKSHVTRDRVCQTSLKGGMLGFLQLFCIYTYIFIVIYFLKSLAMTFVII